MNQSNNADMIETIIMSQDKTREFYIKYISNLVNKPEFKNFLNECFNLDLDKLWGMSPEDRQKEIRNYVDFMMINDKIPLSPTEEN